jgi:hypothetical protein
LIASPSIHGDGNAWAVLEGGTDQKISTLSDKEVDALEAKINALSRVHRSDEDKQAYIEWLERPDTIIRDGEGRHIAVKTLGCSYYYRYKDEWKDLTDDQRHDRLKEWNLQHCESPLPEAEFSEIWKWIVKTHRKTRDKQFEELNNKTKSAQAEANSPVNMPGCISYQISSKPDIWITGTPDNKLIEIMRKTKASDDGLLTVSFVTKKTFTACKPVRIIKHKNPLSFLELQPRYTIQFEGSEPSGNFTIKHKTISEIVSELKNGNALCEKWY